MNGIFCANVVYQGEGREGFVFQVIFFFYRFITGGGEGFTSPIEAFCRFIANLLFVFLIKQLIAKF